MDVNITLLDVALRPIVAPVASLSRLLLRWTGGKRFTGHLFGNRDELRLVMQESAHGLSSEERTMINRVLDLQNLTVRDVTIPMAQVTAITPSTPSAMARSGTSIFRFSFKSSPTTQF